MDQQEPGEQKTPETPPQSDPFEGVPPGCGTPRSWTAFYLALIGFGFWVALLVVLMVIRFRTSAV